MKFIIQRDEALSQGLDDLRSVLHPAGGAEISLVEEAGQKYWRVDLYAPQKWAFARRLLQQNQFTILREE